LTVSIQKAQTDEERAVANLKITEALKNVDTWEELFPVEEIIEAFEEKRKQMGWPDKLSVTPRTLRFWRTKGLAFDPSRGEFNKILYPAKTVEDIAAVRWLQKDCCLNLTQIKGIFDELDFGYPEGLQGILELSKVDRLRRLSTNYPKNRKKIVKLFKTSSMREQRKIKKENLKKLADIYKKYDRNLFESYLKKSGDQLFKEAAEAYQIIEDRSRSDLENIEADFKLGLLCAVAEVKSKEGMNAQKGWALYHQAKPEKYAASRWKLQTAMIYRVIDA